MKKFWLAGLILCCMGVPLTQAQTPDTAKPPYNLDPLSAYSIYLENYRSENYDMALDYGRWMLFAKPRKIEGYSGFDLKTNLDRLISIYGGLAEKKEDPTVRSAYLDSALMVFDIAFETFKGSEHFSTFDWKLKKARFYQKHSNYISNAMQKATRIYMELYKKYPKRLTQRGDGYYVQVILQQLMSAGEKDSALAVVKKSEPYASDKLKRYFDSIRGKLFESPKQRIDYLKTELKKNPKSVKLLDQLLQLYKSQEMYAEAKDIAQKLYELQPTYENAIRLAEIAMNNANYDRAIKYLKSALEKTDDPMKLRRVTLDIAESYLNKGNLQQARKWARKSIQHDKDWGKPYLLISKIYARAVSNCTSGRNMDRKDKVVYWLVLDYLDKALKVDKTTRSTVESRYDSYKAVTPTKEEKFFANWNEGDKIKVDANLHKCYDWINETTTVR